MRPVALALSLAGLSAAASPAATARAVEPALSAVRAREGATIFVGARDPAASPSPPPGVPVIAGPGSGHGEPVFDAYVALAPDGRWSPAARLDPPARGTPLRHRQRPWTVTLQLSGDGDLAGYVLRPLGSELGFDAAYLPRTEGTKALAVAVLDRWTFAVAEQTVSGEVAIVRYTSFGPSFTFQDRGRARVLPGWPPGTRLAGVDGVLEELALFGREASRPVVHVAIVDGSSARALPALELAPAARAAGGWGRDGPFVVTLGRGRLAVHEPDGASWRQVAELELGRDGLLAAAALGADRSGLLALVLDGDRLLAARRSETGWTIDDLSARPEPVETDPARPPGPAARRSGARTAILAAAVALLLPCVVVLSLQVRRLRG